MGKISVRVSYFFAGLGTGFNIAAFLIDGPSLAGLLSQSMFVVIISMYLLLSYFDNRDDSTGE